MKYLIVAILAVVMVSCGAGEPKHKESKEDSSTTIPVVDTSALTTDAADTNVDTVTAIKELVQPETKPTPQPEKIKVVQHCYIRIEGEEKTDTNYVRLSILGDEVKGKYIVTYEGGITRGDLKGTKKGDIITADWTFVTGVDFYSIPVSFKMKRFALFQKPTEVENGKAFIPEDGEYSIRYREIDCGNTN